MSKQLSLNGFNLSVSLNSIDAYVHRVNQIPVLSAEEERDLTSQWFEHGNVDAAKQLVVSHLRFVVHVARGYLGYGLSFADLIQEGNVGLMKAVKRFDPSVGVRLVTFAVHWIKAEMHDFVIRNWRIVRIATTKAQRKLFFKLRSAKQHLHWFTEAEVNHVAQELNVTPTDVREMEMRLQAHDATFDAPEDDDENPTTPELYLADAASDPALQMETWQDHQLQQNAFQKAWLSLSTREQAIMQKRWLQEEKATLHELAAEYNISAERIRQIEQNALRKLQKLN